MSDNSHPRWVKSLGLAAVAALALGAASLAPTPAEAHRATVILAPAAYGYPYYAPAPRHYYPKRRVAHRRCPPGWHFVPQHWNRWGVWVPAKCRPNW